MTIWSQCDTKINVKTVQDGCMVKTDAKKLIGT